MMTRFIGPVKADDLVGGLSREMTLTDKPIYLATDHSHGYRRYGMVLNHPLTQEEFHGFIDEVAPVHGFSIYSIIDDWKMPDINADAYRRLLSMHMSLGRDWADFEVHRRFYMGILDSPPVRVPNYQNVTGVLSNKEITRDSIRYATRRKRDMRSIFNLPEMANLREKFARFLSLQEPIASKNHLRRQSSDALIGYVSGMSIHKRQRLFQRFYDSLNPEEQKIIFDIYCNSLRYKQYQIGNVTVYSTTTPKLQERVTIDKDKWSADAVLAEENGVIGYKILQETKRTQSRPFLKPSISWSRSEVGGGWNMDISHAFYPEALERFVENEKDKNREITMNPLAGLMFVAYCSPEIRNSSDWPQRQGLPGGRYQQVMRAAQAPVLALQKRDVLLASYFVKALEKYADAHS